MNKLDTENIVSEMREHVKTEKVKVKEFGEVMTPIWLVEDMLNALPEDVWTNPDLKWLDPCNGVGVFPSIIVSRLMSGLEDEIPCDEDRYKHIVENMLYVGELQQKNMDSFISRFDPAGVYSLNTFCGSFLTEDFDSHMKNEWGVEKFDIIVGNPPYQELKPGNKKSQPLWHKFVLKGFEICKKGGFFSMIHPSGWREPKGIFKKTGNLILSKKVLFATLYGVKRGIEFFGVGTSCDWYVVQNCESDNSLSTVKFQDGSVEQVDLSNVEFIPNANMKKIQSLIAKDDEGKVQVLHSYAYTNQRDHVSKTQSEEICHPVVYTCLASGKINFVWSSCNDRGHFGQPKVIWSNGSSPSVHVDSTGKYGLTEFTYAIADKPENLPMIKQALESKEFINLMKDCRLNGNHRYNYKVIALFRKDFWKEFV